MYKCSFMFRLWWLSQPLARMSALDHRISSSQLRLIIGVSTETPKRTDDFVAENRLPGCIESLCMIEDISDEALTPCAHIITNQQGGTGCVEFVSSPLVVRPYLFLSFAICPPDHPIVRGKRPIFLGQLLAETQKLTPADRISATKAFGVLYHRRGPLRSHYLGDAAQVARRMCTMCSFPRSCASQRESDSGSRTYLNLEGRVVT